jgi:hypothetical protein
LPLGAATAFERARPSDVGAPGLRCLRSVLSHASFLSENEDR